MFDTFPVEVTKNIKDFIKDKDLHKNQKVSLVMNDPSLDTQKIRDLIDKLSGRSTFLDILQEFIVRADLTDPAFYTKSNISRQVWHNLVMGKSPKRETVYKIILTLELSYAEASLLMNKAGYEMDWANKRNLVVIFCLIHKYYGMNIDNYLNEVNEKALFSEE